MARSKILFIQFVQFIHFIQFHSIYLIRLIHSIYSINFLDEDPEFPSCQLNTHGPAVLGWRSNCIRLIEFSEIVLKLNTPGKIFKIQVLAHQFIIRKLNISIKLLQITNYVKVHSFS